MVVTVFMAAPVHLSMVEKSGLPPPGTLSMPDAGATMISYATLRPASTPDVPSIYGSMPVDSFLKYAKFYCTA